MTFLIFGSVELKLCSTISEQNFSVELHGASECSLVTTFRLQRSNQENFLHFVNVPCKYAVLKCRILLFSAKPITQK